MAKINSMREFNILLWQRTAKYKNLESSEENSDFKYCLNSTKLSVGNAFCSLFHSSLLGSGEIHNSMAINAVIPCSWCTLMV